MQNYLTRWKKLKKILSMEMKKMYKILLMMSLMKLIMLLKKMKLEMKLLTTVMKLMNNQKTLLMKQKKDKNMKPQNPQMMLMNLVKKVTNSKILLSVNRLSLMKIMTLLEIYQNHYKINQKQKKLIQLMKNKMLKIMLIS